MGGGNYDDQAYQDYETRRKATGANAFAYSATVAAQPYHQRKAHETLDPLNLTMRESRDSVEHPNSRAVVIMFDETGSERERPGIFRDQLSTLNGILVRKGYLDDPQILFGAIGDAYSDQVPIQIGQFESDNRQDAHLRNIYLEGNGGGQKHESYELAMYAIARHTDIDCWNKRQQKGYMFFTGDEMSYPAVNRQQVQTVFGENTESDIPTGKILAELLERYEVFMLLPTMGTMHAGDEQVLQHWKNLLGERALLLEDPNAISETIALQIGLCEGTIDLTVGTQHLREFGSSAAAIAAATKAVAVYQNTAKSSSVTVTPSSGSLSIKGESRNRRI